METIASTPRGSRREGAQTDTAIPTSGLRWNFWGFHGSALGLSLWMPTLAISSGWSGAGVALSEAAAAVVLLAALVIWRNQHRLSAFQGVLLLLGAGLVASASFLGGMHWLNLSARAVAWPEAVPVPLGSLLWTLTLFPILALWFWLIHRTGRIHPGAAPGVEETSQGQPTSGAAELNEKEWNNPRNWTAGIYFSKCDSRVWVPKQIPAMGWTVNLGHRRGVAWMLGVFFAIIGILAGALIWNSSRMSQYSTRRAESARHQRENGPYGAGAAAVSNGWETFIDEIIV